MPRSARPALLAAVLLAVTACSTPVEVPPGTHASDPACGEVLVATPETLLGAQRRDTASQATTAWGEPPVRLRCGVEPPGPTTDRCVSVETAAGEAVDWISLHETEPQDDGGGWTFVTYGRTPAVEVEVPVAAVGGGQATAFLAELGPAVGVVEPDRTCVGPQDVG
ncbi:DUF3515 family protein [Georgenia alba]|uniref:DUF3515 family protein n=1 Tax=Georgenia alba TaxID=2233858 RepID=A0ABW2Q7J4_9MICO